MKPTCSGEAAAHVAASGDHCQCADCRLFFPGGDLFCYPHGEICQDCHEERRDNGLTKEAFGRSPREFPVPRHALDAIPARIQLACAFPPSKGYRGASTTVADLSMHGLFAGHLGITPTKQAAIRLMVERNLEPASFGKGNKASRRISTNQIA